MLHIKSLYAKSRKNWTLVMEPLTGHQRSGKQRIGQYDWTGRYDSDWKERKEHFKRLTFAEVVNIVDGQVLGGRGICTRRWTNSSSGRCSLKRWCAIRKRGRCHRRQPDQSAWTAWSRRRGRFDHRGFYTRHHIKRLVIEKTCRSCRQVTIRLR